MKSFIKDKNRTSLSHCFAICAYKESPYLEECIRSIKGQSMKSRVIMVTSTPCEYIERLAVKYRVPLFVREGESSLKEDWNFAYNCADTEWVTIAHQDDRYGKSYVKYMTEKIEKYNNDCCGNCCGEDEEEACCVDDDFDTEETEERNCRNEKTKYIPYMYFTDYRPIKDGKPATDANCRIRKLLRSPMRFKCFASSNFWRRRVLSLGNSICCPTVTYNKKLLGRSVFTSDMAFNIDWDTFLKLSDEKVVKHSEGFDKVKYVWAYSPRVLTFYRVHDGATSKEFIENHGREAEDTAMMDKFWPKKFTKFIMKFYVKAYDTYRRD